ncbi:MAG: hypothetical protein LBN41_10370 [Enterobacteriaceae bacterium]|jgi:hypothetical protein|nr:hypothetical protein [Enterobacteriaceae bacterium]
MNNKFNRAIEHLINSSTSEEVINSIQAVEDLFSLTWLSKQEGHRLQMLWARRDVLSTSELYSLGKSIIKLSINNKKWLDATAKEIKKDADSSHGLITEMIIIGSLSTALGVITPCPKSFKIYDYTVDFETGFRHKVSIKNYDITKHEKEFNKRSEIIRCTFKNYLKARGLSGRLTVLLEHETLTDELTREICFFITFKMKDYNFYPFSNGSGGIGFHEIDEFDKKTLVSPSDTILIIAKHHFNEQRNIIDKINEANDKLLSDPDDPKSLKQLVIRLGSTANIEMINDHLTKLGADWERCGFDLYFLFQPQVVSDIEKDSTMITTSIKHGVKGFFPATSDIKNKLENMKSLKMEFGIGAISSESSPMILMINGTQTDISIKSHYVFQKGDLYLRAEKKGSGYEGSLAKMAPGIITHSVFDNMTISPICYSQDDRVLII